MPDVDVVYCEGWDPASREAYGTMAEAVAAGRDRDAAQYAVLLRENGRPVALVQVAWAAGYLGVHQFDEQARRVREFDFRVLDDPDRLYWCGFRTWLPGSPHDPEFFSRRPKLTLSIGSDGRAESGVSYHGRGAGHYMSSRVDIPGALRTIGRAAFGDWRSYLGRGLFDPASAPPAIPVSTGLTADPGDDEPGGQRAGTTGPGWTPPAALGPRNIEALFTAGARLRGSGDAWSEGQIAVVREPHEAGTLRLPTGRVVAADPGFMDEYSQPFTVTVPPGEYAVSIALAAGEEEDAGAGDGRVTAVRVLIRDEPAITWEMALLPGQDPRMASAGQFFGFGVDTGMGAFLDAAGREALAYGDEGDPEGFVWWTDDPASGANMVTYFAGLGDGDYPVRPGRYLPAARAVRGGGRRPDPRPRTVPGLLRRPHLPGPRLPRAGTLRRGACRLRPLYGDRVHRHPQRLQLDHRHGEPR